MRLSTIYQGGFRLIMHPPCFDHIATPVLPARHNHAATLVRRWIAVGIIVMMLPMFSGCRHIVPPAVNFGDTPAPDTLAISRAIAQWPLPSIAFFSGTLQRYGHRFEVIGRWHFISPWDFRFTLAGPNGRILLDLRDNWAGIHILHRNNAIPANLALAIGRDLSLAMRMPKSLGVIHIRRHQTRLKMIDPWGQHFIWEFGGFQGRLRKLQVRQSSSDILTVEYAGFNLRGQPATMALYRPANNYLLILRFDTSR